MVKIGVIFYTTYGHTYQLAEKIAEGARSAGAEVELRRIPETLPDAVVEKMGGIEARKKWWHIPEVKPEDLKKYDGIAIGGGTRFGNPSAQWKTFIDSLGGLWMENALVGKFACAFGSTSTQHGGNEMTLLTSFIPLFHLGFTIVGMKSHQSLREGGQLSGGTPYGMSTIVGHNAREVSALELEGATVQGAHLVDVMTKYGKPAAPKKVTGLDRAPEGETDAGKKGCWCF